MGPKLKMGYLYFYSILAGYGVGFSFFHTNKIGGDQKHFCQANSIIQLFDISLVTIKYTEIIKNSGIFLTFFSSWS